jgi:hypothetical protein
MVNYSARGGHRSPMAGSWLLSARPKSYRPAMATSVFAAIRQQEQITNRRLGDCLLVIVNQQQESYWAYNPIGVVAGAE